MKAAFKKPANRRRNRKARQRYAKKKVTATPSAPLTRAIQRVINRNVETKYVAYRPYNAVTGQVNNTNFSQAINASTEAFALIPPIQLGDGDHQRTGNVIKPTSLTVKGFVSLLANMPDTAIIDVDIYILRHRAIKDVNYYAQLGNFADLLNSGDGLNVGYDGSWTASAMPVNASTYTCLAHRKIRLEKGYGDANTFISRGDPTAVGSYDAYPRLQKNFSIKVKMPQTLKYKTDADTTPVGDYPFMVIGWNTPTNLDTTSSIQIIKATATTHLYYKDA